MKKTVKNLLIAAFASGIAFTASAQLVPFTDVNFKAALLSSICADTNGDGVFDSDVDTNNDGKIQVSEALAVTGLIVDNKFINSLGGIQYFSNLQYLSCETNHLTSLNLQTLTNLQTLNCGSNQLPSLNVQALTNLQSLSCHWNQLSSLDVQGLTHLRRLFCDNNLLPSLDVQGLTTLEELNCSDNQLPNLNVQGLSNLWNLVCDRNQLTSLEVQSLGNLENLSCNNNQLTSLNVQGLTRLRYLYSNDNPLNCLSFLPNALVILNIANTNITCLPNIPAGIVNVNTLPLCPTNSPQICVVATDEATKEEHSLPLFPNPTSGHLTVNCESLEGIGNLQIIDVFGQTVLSQKITETTTVLNTENLPQGSYFIHLSGKNGKTVGKFVKM